MADAKASIGDERQFPFFITSTAATRSIRHGLAEGDPGLSQVLAVYTGLVELANEKRAGNAAGTDTEPFAAERKKLVAYSGTSIRTVQKSTEAMERLGLLRIERRKIAGDKNLPNRYVLVGSVGGVGVGDAPTLDAGGAGRVGAGGAGKSSRTNCNDQEKPPSSPLAGDDDVGRVHSHYVETFGKTGKAAELREDERRIIRNALKAANDVSELLTCITACEASDFHMRRNGDSGRKGGKYNSLGVIFKPRPRLNETQRSRIDWWLEKREEQEGGAAPSQPSPYDAGTVVAQV